MCARSLSGERESVRRVAGAGAMTSHSLPDGQRATVGVAGVRLSALLAQQAVDPQLPQPELQQDSAATETALGTTLREEKPCQTSEDAARSRVATFAIRAVMSGYWSQEPR